MVSKAYHNLNKFYKANSATISSAAGAFASALNLDVKSFENTIATFAETSAVLIKGLDTLGQLHPFVGSVCFAFHVTPHTNLRAAVVATAFKVIIALDLARRASDKKVLSIKIQMQDLMIILFQCVFVVPGTFCPILIFFFFRRLRHMRDPHEKGPNGLTLSDRFSALMQNIAKDIIECGSACDVYVKKSFLVASPRPKGTPRTNVP
jgi:hypothetical protein